MIPDEVLDFIYYHRGAIVKGIYVIVITSIFVTGCVSYWNDRAGLEDDNMIEEGAEFAIEQFTGMDIDLTPGSPE